MHWLDIVFVVIVLIFGFIGLKRGFLKSILALFTFAVTLALVIWLAPKVVPVVDGWFNGALSTFFTEKMAGLVDSFGGPDIGHTLTEDKSTYDIIDGFTGVSGVFLSLLKIVVGNKVLVSGTEVSPYFSTALGNFVTLFVGAVVLYILIEIILGLLAKLFDKIEENRAISGLDRVMGFLLWVVKGLLIVAIILVICKIISFLPLVNEFISNLLDSSDWLSRYANWLYEMLDKLIEQIDFNALIHGGN